MRRRFYMGEAELEKEKEEEEGADDNWKEGEGVRKKGGFNQFLFFFLGFEFYIREMSRNFLTINFEK